MRNKKSLLIAVLSLILSMIFCIAATACGKETPPESDSTPAEQEEQEKSAITLPVDNLNMDVGETYTVTATLKNLSGTVVWASSNTAIATVSDKGVITAVSEGIATITATCGEFSAKCYVTVVNNGYVPIVTVSDTDITLIKGYDFFVDPALILNGEKLDVTFEYTSSDESVATAENGIITAIERGTANITVAATYESVKYQEIIAVKVVKDVTISASENSVELFTSNLSGGETEIEISYTVNGTDETNVEAVCEADCVNVVNSLGKVTIKALKAGNADIVLRLTEDGMTYDTVISVVCKKPFVIGDDIYLTAESISSDKIEIPLSSLDVSDLETVTINGGEVNYDKNADSVSVNKDFVSKGDNSLELSFGSVDISAELVIADIVIKTKEDLNAFIKELSDYGTGPSNTQSSAMYVVLAADMDYGGDNLITNSSRASYQTNWCGIFDGRGHVIKNITVDRGGVFGYIRGGSVKNLGLVNITSSKSASETGGLLCMTLTGGGKINNCFVEGRFNNSSDTTGGGIAEFAYNNNYVSNCVAVVSGAKYALCGQDTKDFLVPAKSYAVSADAVYAYKNNSTSLYADSFGLMKDVASLEREDGWNRQWKVENGRLVFGSYALANAITMDDTLEVLPTSDTVSIDLSDYSVSSVSSVTIGEVAVDNFAYQNGELSFARDYFANNEIAGDCLVRIEVSSGDKIITLNKRALVATNIIKTKEDLQNFIKQLVGYGNGGSNLQSASMYVVLDEDIDYENGNLVTDTERTKFDTNWCGIFDGRGHVIKNLTVDRGGVFGYIRGGVVKNLGLVNITSNKAASETGGLLCMMLTGGGKVFGCLVEGKFTNASTANGAGIAEFAYNGKDLNHCIAIVEGAKYAVSGGSANSEYCYAVSSDAVYAYSTNDGATVLYRTMSEFTDNRVAMPGTGWSDLWKIEDGQIVFGSYKTQK